MDAWLKNWIDEWDEGYERLEAAKRERASGRMIDLEEEHGNLYDILDTWMNVPEVKRIRSTYCK